MCTILNESNTFSNIKVNKFDVLMVQPPANLKWYRINHNIVYL